MIQLLRFDVPPQAYDYDSFQKNFRKVELWANQVTSVGNTVDEKRDVSDFSQVFMMMGA